MNVDAVHLGPDAYAVLGEAVVGAASQDGLEHCGVWFGVQQRVAGVRTALVAGSVELPNMAADPAHQFEFNPVDQEATWAEVEQLGFEVLAVWHTHPEGPEVPSGTDLANMQQWLLYPVLWPTGASTWAIGVNKLAENEQGFTTIPYTVVEGVEMAAQAAATSRG